MARLTRAEGRTCSSRSNQLNASLKSRRRRCRCHTGASWYSGSSSRRRSRRTWPRSPCLRGTRVRRTRYSDSVDIHSFRTLVQSCRGMAVATGPCRHCRGSSSSFSTVEWSRGVDSTLSTPRLLVQLQQQYEYRQRQAAAEASAVTTKHSNPSSLLPVHCPVPSTCLAGGRLPIQLLPAAAAAARAAEAEQQANLYRTCSSFTVFSAALLLDQARRRLMRPRCSNLKWTLESRTATTR